MKKILAFALATLLVVAMAVPAVAATKSREQTTDPHVKKIEVKGQMVDFAIYDESGNPIGDYSSAGTLKATDKDGNQASYQYLLVTYRERDNYPGAIKDALEKAYASWQAGSLDSVTGGKVLDALVYSGLKKTDAAGNVSYVGIDDISGAQKMVLAFTNGYTAAILINGDTYLKVSEADGFIKIGEAGVVGLFKDKSTGGGGGTSPQTGYESQTGVAVAVSLVAVLTAIVGLCYLADKKRA